MMLYRCDGCGREMQKGALRYTVGIDVRAAYDTLEIGLADLVKDHRAEMEALVRRMNEAEAGALEASVHKKMEFDLCPDCQRAYIANPMGFHPESAGEAAVDVDAFLRSLGYGGGSDAAGDE